MSDITLVLLVNFLGEIKTTPDPQGGSDEDEEAVNVWSGPTPA